ncbi:PilZ domain-containing protein [Aestuariicella hydrocarbonica]|uniref:PilZ domain-containing protein n=1 Tax=Pseudomaricurvus hydrocarbonicus TaxID=1470433 RepID=A0A9E5JPL7_9GAMM|nr:PilZ domain-containing protein [Aestuariicella hydrocarbonica]NHO64263.1 PilZ domain-containing protein [Aestuariicella hydrocarbonica]
MTVDAYSPKERRYFPRVAYRGHASLITVRNEWPVHMVDLCFNGALVALRHNHVVHPGEAIVLTLETENGEPIKMQGKIAHQKDHLIGIECRANSIDHQSRLRVLVGR